MPVSGSLTDERRQQARSEEAGLVELDSRAPESTGSARKRTALWTATAVAGCAVVFGIPPPAHFDAPGVRAAIETLIATGAIISATLLLLSFRQDRQLGNLLLFTALATVGVTDFVFSALPVLTESEDVGFGSGPQVACDALAAFAFAAAALIPPRRLDRPGARPLRFAGVVAASTIGLAVLIDSIAGHPSLGGTAPHTGITAATAHPVFLIEAILSGAILFVAGAAFLSRPGQDARALGAASFLLAAARLQYLVLPAMAPDWVTTRDALRLAAYALLLATALARYARTRRAIAAASLAVERERIARDLHDGLAQDLAYIALQGQTLTSVFGTEHPLTRAAQHAVAASRGVIVDLSASDANSTDAALRQVADELAARFGIEVDVTIAGGSDGAPPRDLDPARREELVRIAREAIVNAARHGGARHIRLVVERDDDQVHLRVSDDGHGMPQAKLHGRGGFGLQMMRARASTLGGQLVMLAAEQGGVEVEVTFPRQNAGAP